MKVLWITNILFPEAAAQLTGNKELKSSGGWMLGAAKGLIELGDVDLYVATVSSCVRTLTKLKGANITYFLIPLGKGNLRINKEYNTYWQKINSEVRPDVVHIHGTEYSHGYAYMKACGCDNVVVSIQGLKSACSDYYHYGITKSEIYKTLTLRDLLRGGIIHDQRSCKKSAKYEIEMLKLTKHIIGRTSWDKERTWAINPNAHYHFCNETLREEFYDGSQWDYKKCNKHTIFLSQAGYPIKGLHQVLKAMPLILRHFPNTVIRIAGNDITKVSTLQDYMHFVGYGRYLRLLIKKLGLEGKVLFTGSLNAEEMKNEYLTSNVFVCPSSIENSPNSLGEAQILGVPCVAGYVGGVPDMMIGREHNLYRFEEVEMLAYKICSVFENKDMIQGGVVDEVIQRHSPTTNATMLLDIYRSIIKLKS